MQQATRKISVTLCGVLAGALLCAATPAAEDNATAPLRQGDTVLITVAGETDLSGVHRVDENGMVTLGYAGSVRADGLTPAALREALLARLKPDYLLDPRVTVLRVTSSGTVATVAAKSLRVRGSPNAAASIAGGLVEDQEVRVTARSGPWCAIVDARAADADALTGWVACRYLSWPP